MMVWSRRARASREPQTACFHCEVMSLVRVVVFISVLLLCVFCLPFAASVARLHRSLHLHIVETTYHLTHFARCQTAPAGRQNDAVAVALHRSSAALLVASDEAALALQIAGNWERWLHVLFFLDALSEPLGEPAWAT
jgi:hypothetical protein